MNLSEGQVKDLASPLVGIVAEFYQDPKNEEDFQQWLLQQKESTDESSQ
jgi:hypothetical protein